MKSIKKSLSTTQIIALGFFVAILIGTALLMLPVSSADGRVTPLIDSLFTATTSICVTGLVVVPTYLHWSAFGKAVILLLIQLGGLGIISFTTGIMMVIGRRITLHDRILLEDALNLNTLSGLVAFLRKIFCGTFIIEGIGALGYAFLFIPKYGLLRGIWYSIFHSVSAFCNAGIDLLGNNSLCNYLTNTWMNVVTMFLIISGGIGFIVWWDLLDAFKNLIKKEKAFSYIVKKLHVHTKLVLITTFILLFGGMLLILLFEYDNTATIGNLDFYHKILASLSSWHNVHESPWLRIDGICNVLYARNLFLISSSSATSFVSCPIYPNLLCIELRSNSTITFSKIRISSLLFTIL